ncbi:glutamine amidotransferase [Thermoleophilia bacterium SCSIO 60948]|nr:glutamine amidotransferase [Thermoleophilia bacterium SCSIO 60948]
MSAPPDRALRILWLYPEQMNIYADRGNILFLQRRCEWRGIGFELTSAGLGEDLPAETDLIYIGGGQDRDQRLVAADLRETKREAIAAHTAAGGGMLAVCGGYQLLGRFYELGDERIEGLGLAGLETRREPGPRLIGNVAIETGLGAGEGSTRTLAGFENHGGRTYLDAGERPLGRVIAGHGNNGGDRAEGVWRDGIVGTYLHGPLLPKNAWLADHLIARGLGFEAAAQLSPLPSELEDAAHESARRAALHPASG